MSFLILEGGTTRYEKHDPIDHLVGHRCPVALCLRRRRGRRFDPATAATTDD
jgi:hypothetical protein